MSSGLDEFKVYFDDLKQVAALAAPGSAAPILAYLLSLSPPWPPAIVAITSISQLIVAIFVFYFLSYSGRVFIGWVISVSALILCVFSIVYLTALSLFTYETPVSHQRFVKGFRCNGDAQIAFADKCPWLDLAELETARFDAERLWDLWSIALTRVGLVTLWLTSFVALSVIIGAFVAQQRRIKRARIRTY